MFEYDATYYSYLLAKVASQKLYDSGVGQDKNGELRVSKDVMALFKRGATFDVKDLTK